MRESCTYGVVRGALSNERPYRNHHCLGRGASAPNSEILRSLLYETRTHLALDKDAPVTRQIQRIGSIKSHAILGGLHHHYARA
jgi:hypothetical protein